MLSLIRKYQKWIFYVVAFIVILTFSFFGTSSPIEIRPEAPPVLRLVDGTELHRSTIDRLVRFLSAEEGDQEGVRNFLSDGVVVHDFLENGLGYLLFLGFEKDLTPALQERIRKEASYSFYRHPSAPFLSQESALSYLSPHFQPALMTVRRGDATPSDLFLAQTDLFLAQREIPPQGLRRLLKMQEQQFHLIDGDPHLSTVDLHPFGYRSLNDWFGEDFLHLMAQTILNIASLAEMEGVKLAAEEPLYDLQRVAKKKYDLLVAKNNLDISFEQYFGQALDLLKLSLKQATDLWERVLLFRRYVNDRADRTIGDRFVLGRLYKEAFRTYEGSSYRISSPWRFQTTRDLFLFQTYLSLIAQDVDPHRFSQLPTRFQNVATLQKNYPQLLEKKFQVEIATLDLAQSGSKIDLRSLWEWQVSPEGREKIAHHFQERLRATTDPSEFFTQLEALPFAERSRIDEWSRIEMVRRQKELVDEELTKITSSQREWDLLLKGKTDVIDGAPSSEELIAFLQPLEVGKEKRVSFDERFIHRIKLLEKEEVPTIISFQKASQGDLLQQHLHKELKDYYQILLQKKSDLILSEAGETLPFAKAESKVAFDLYRPLIEELSATSPQIATMEEKEKTARELRFSNLLLEVRKKVLSGTKEEKVNPLVAQWQPVLEDFSIAESEKVSPSMRKAFSELKVGEFSDLIFDEGGFPLFLKTNAIKEYQPDQKLVEASYDLEKLIADGAKRTIAGKAIDRFQKGQNYTLDYLSGTP